MQPRTYLYGVDVTGSRFFRIPAVLAAVEFAATAHAAQRRKTGEPYVTHCIETALIVEACLPNAISSTEHDRCVPRPRVIPGNEGKGCTHARGERGERGY